MKKLFKIEIVKQDRGYFTIEVNGEIWTDYLGDNMRFIYLSDAEAFAKELKENLEEDNE